MIRYALRCASGHAFESWFQSGEAYDRLAAAGHVACAVCGDARVSKALMAPAVAVAAAPPSATAAATQAGPPPGAASGPVAAGPPPAPGPMLVSPDPALEKALRAFRARVEATADDVGRDFARVAREIHEGEEEARPIYGEATGAEARALLEDGVPVAPLPWSARRSH